MCARDEAQAKFTRACGQASGAGRAICWPEPPAAADSSATAALHQTTAACQLFGAWASGRARFLRRPLAEPTEPARRRPKQTKPSRLRGSPAPAERASSGERETM